MKEYKTLHELDIDIMTCKTEIWKLLDKYDFGIILSAKILSEEEFHFLNIANQPKRDKLIKNDLNKS